MTRDHEGNSEPRRPRTCATGTSNVPPARKAQLYRCGAEEAEVAGLVAMRSFKVSLNFRCHTEIDTTLLSESRRTYQPDG